VCEPARGAGNRDRRRAVRTEGLAGDLGAVDAQMHEAFGGTPPVARVTATVASICRPGAGLVGLTENGHLRGSGPRPVARPAGPEAIVDVADGSFTDATQRLPPSWCSENR